MQSTDQAVSVEMAKKVGLNEAEFERIQTLLERMPNLMELSIFSVLWSEECSNKNSAKWTSSLPNVGKQVIGGLVDVGEGRACKLSMRSEFIFQTKEANSKCRDLADKTHLDVITTGTQPIASLNSFQFDSPENDNKGDSVKSIVNEMGAYSHRLGVPMFEEKVFFKKQNNQPALVNAMSIGVLKIDDSISAVAEGIKNTVLIVGAPTEIGENSDKSADKDLAENQEDELPLIEKEDLFYGKVQMEAVIEAVNTGVVVGMQGIGTGGLCFATAKMCTNSETGMILHLDKTPTRQSDVKLNEILLSENRGHILIVAVKGEEETLFEVFRKWNLECKEIGEVTDTGQLDFRNYGVTIAELPAQSLIQGRGAPAYDHKTTKPKYFKEIKKFNLGKVKSPKKVVEAAKKLFASPNLISKRTINGPTESTENSIESNGSGQSDASVIEVEGSKKLLALTIDGNPTYAHADPCLGGMIAVAEAARNIICSGATPTAITNCLNFGDPKNPEVYYQFVNVVKGIGDACRKFDTPVIGGQVNFNNESVDDDKIEPILPTPFIGMLGIIEDPAYHVTLGFKEEGDLIYVLGNIYNDLGSSEYLREVHGIHFSPPPHFDLYEEFEIQKHIRKLIRKKIVRSAHDVSTGGLFTTLMQSAIDGDLGFNIETVDVFRKDAFLFGESQGRITLTLAPEQEDTLQNYLVNNNVSFTKLGEVFGDVAIIDNENFGHINDWKRIQDETFSQKMDQ